MKKTILARMFVNTIRIVFITILVLVLALALIVPFGNTTAVSAANGTVYFVNRDTGDDSLSSEDAQSPDTPWQ